MFLTLLFALTLTQAPTNGAAVFENKCASCHTATPEGRTPSLASLRQRTPALILDALTTGPMREQGSEMTDAERRAVGEYLGMRPPAAATPATSVDPMAGRCTATRAFDPATGARWTGWSSDLTNTRFQPATQAGMTAEQVPKLELKWAF